MFENQKNVLYTGIGAIVLLVILLLTAIVKSVSAISAYSSYVDYMDKYEAASEILKYRNQLKEIDAKHNEVASLTTICLKSRAQPFTLHDVSSCKDSALNVLGFRSSFTKIKEMASKPLPTDVVLQIKAK